MEIFNYGLDICYSLANTVNGTRSYHSLFQFYYLVWKLKEFH